MKKLVFTFLMALVSVFVRAQEVQENGQSAQEVAVPMTPTPDYEIREHTQQQKSRPTKLPNYGSLMIDLGANFFRIYPPQMALNYWGSRLASGSVYYNIPVGNSPLSINPGIGVSFHSYTFKNRENILARDKKSRSTVLEKGSTYFSQSSKIVHSALHMRYVDFMLEAKFNANKHEPKTSFLVALGVKTCWLWKASTIVAYKEDDAIKKQKNSESFNLNKIRWGGYARLGWGRFGLCYTHMVSSLFQEDKGPDDNITQTGSITLSVDLF